MNKSNFWMKLHFYIMSLMVLFVMTAVLTFDLNYDNKGFSCTLNSAFALCLSLLMLICGFLCFCYVEWKWKGTTNPPCRIRRIKNENYEFMTFLTTYIMPLVAIDLTQIRFIVVFIVLLTLIGFVFLKMDLYYGNPTLAIFGYRLFRATIEYRNAQGKDVEKEVVLISKELLREGMSVVWIPVDDGVWVAKECTNDRGGAQRKNKNSLC